MKKATGPKVLQRLAWISGGHGMLIAPDNQRGGLMIDPSGTRYGLTIDSGGASVGTVKHGLTVDPHG